MNTSTSPDRPVLSVERLTIDFGPRRVVDELSFALQRGRTLCIAGESGSGKSLTSLAIMGLLPRAASVPGGAIIFEGRDLLGLPERQLQPLRGKRLGMIFQEPMTSLNPLMTVGQQLEETLRRHEPLGRREIAWRAREMLDAVRMPHAEKRLAQYPHELSGGMRQRVMIAMAMLCRPDVLIADEPTTALDVTIQAQIMALLLKLQRERGMGLILITHDLAVVAEMGEARPADGAAASPGARVAVMYAGQIVETGPVPALFDAPRHPYTQALLAAIPEHNKGARRLSALPGIVPGALDRPTGCLLGPRCARAQPQCRAERPALVDGVRCFFPGLPGTASPQEAAHV